MRAYADGDLIYDAETTLTAATVAAQIVITVASATAFSNGDEVVIDGVLGMTELNGRQFILSDKSGSTFKLKDSVTGAYINSSGYSAWTSGGSVRKVMEIVSPYEAVHFDGMQYASSFDLMYITHPALAPRKLTVTSGDVFTLGTFSRTNDPFSASIPAVPIHFITINWFGETLIHTNTGTWHEGVLYNFSGVVGTTEINGQSYYVEIDPSPSSQAIAFLRTPAGGPVDSSSWTPYISGGTATPVVENPLAVAFYEGRLGYFGTNQRPNAFFLSRSPNNLGNPRYDDFTTGTAADNACVFALAPASGRIDYIVWARGTSRHLFIGTEGGPFRISGGGLDEPITPSSINVRQFDSTACKIAMAAGGARVFFIQRGGVTIRSVRYNADTGDIESYDMCLNAEHIGYSPIRRVFFQEGRPDILWVLREDGILAGMSVHGPENIAGWHRHEVGGPDAQVKDGAVVADSGGVERRWLCVGRTLGGATVHFVELETVLPKFPDLVDFYSDPDEKVADTDRYENALYRMQEQYVYLDAAGTYDGADRGRVAEATLTPGAVSGASVTFTASQNVFRSTDVGSELWKKPLSATGVGSGRAVITAYVSPTQVTCEITSAFDSTDAIAAGDWYFAVLTISGLWHLEGERVAVTVDGAVYSDGLTDGYPVVTVATGRITLNAHAAVVHVGFPYEGMLKTHNLDLRIAEGNAQAKSRNIVGLNVRFLHTLGVEYGTSPYRMQRVEHRASGQVAGRPIPPFSGIKDCYHEDEWSGVEGEKHITIMQKLPLPCVVQMIDIQYMTGGED